MYLNASRCTHFFAKKKLYSHQRRLVLGLIIRIIKSKIPTLVGMLLPTTLKMQEYVGIFELSFYHLFCFLDLKHFVLVIFVSLTFPFKHLCIFMFQNNNDHFLFKTNIRFYRFLSLIFHFLLYIYIYKVLKIIENIFIILFYDLRPISINKNTST